jgi:DNA processing protein
VEELRALIGLKMCEGIGDISAYKLLSFFGSAAAVFTEKRRHLSNIPGLSPHIFNCLATGIDWKAVEKELLFIEKNQVQYVSLFDADYPSQLKLIDSPPILLFFSGSIQPLNNQPCLSIVGTRNPTNYGIEAVEAIVDAVKNFNVNIISGLAHGIDIAAHKNCLKRSIYTYGIVAHGMHTLYPPVHSGYARQMCEAGGGIITEFFSGEKPNRENFPKRNRIIAGISAATLVIEASKKSGTLITAQLALNYKRKVFALPGRYLDKYSEGCNLLLKNKQVGPISSIDSLMDELGFKQRVSSTNHHTQPTLSLPEQTILQLIAHYSRLDIDRIATETSMNMSCCAAHLFNLEMLGLIRSLPGKTYELC